MSVSQSVDAGSNGRDPGVCVPPPSPEVLDEMTDQQVPEDFTLGEIYRALAGMRQELDRNTEKVVYKDVFQAEKESLQKEIAAARSLAMWSLGVMILGVLSAIGALVVAINT